MAKVLIVACVALVVIAVCFGLKSIITSCPPEAASCEWHNSFVRAFAENDKFWVSFGTLVLAAFKVLLMVGTFFLFFATQRLAKSGERAQRDNAGLVKASFRGFLFPADVRAEYVGDILGPRDRLRMRVQIQVGRLGRSPCVLRESFGGFLTEEPTSSAVRYPDGVTQTHNELFGDTERLYHFGSYVSPSSEPCFLVGYVKYIDAFGDEHTARFCYRVTGATQAPRCEMAGAREWNGWD